MKPRKSSAAKAAPRQADWMAHVPEGADAGFVAVTILRRVEPSGWLAALQRVSDGQRAAVELFLRAAAARYRRARAARATNTEFDTIGGQP